MTIQDPRMLSNDWMTIGCKVPTYACWQLDLLVQSGLIPRLCARDSERLCS